MMSLLPPNRSPLEVAFDQLGEKCTSVFFEFTALWNPTTCPVALLPWLAWGFSLDYWNPLASDEVKRLAIANSIETHRRKGTVLSVRLALESLGWGTVKICKTGIDGFPDYDIVVDEGVGDAFCDGSIYADGTYDCGSSESFAKYNVRFNRAISIQQSQDVRQLLKLVTPARCVLNEINFVQASNICDGSIVADGTFTAGVV